MLDKGVDDADWIVLGNVIIHMLRKQGALTTVLAFNETLHDSPRFIYAQRILYLGF